MNRIMKICLWIAIPMIVAGGVVVCASFLMGARGWRDAADADNTAVVSETLSGELDSFTLDINYGEVYIAEGPELKVEAEGVSDRFSWKLENGTLTVREKGSFRSGFYLFGNYIGDKLNEKRVITLTLPKGTKLKDLDIDVGAGYVEFDGMTADKADIDIGAGSMDAGELTVTGKCRLSAGTGSIAVTEITAEKLYLETGVGSIEAGAQTDGDISIDCGVGGITLTLQDSEDSYNYKFDSGVGGVTIGDSDYSGLGKNKNIDNGAGKTISIECGVGSVEVFFEQN